MAIPFDVLAEPSRRQILDLLLERPRLVGELTEHLGLTQPGTSKHLRVLREAGLVRVRRDAQRRWYELCPEPLAEADAWLAPYRRLWTDRLDALERHLDTMPELPGAGLPGAAGEPGPRGAGDADVPDARDVPPDATDGEAP
ncbi:transcriptional regulator [Streptomyces antioxidans]|uniref:Transcriptional regulator n=1 Tax=Streptomyces antioxidans TaxID=1507734 RepID=A0A1V4CWQ2_9ACTN|nr:transcriptional regulator [Streptomyces antioxidans]